MKSSDIVSTIKDHEKRIKELEDKLRAMKLDQSVRTFASVRGILRRKILCALRDNGELSLQELSKIVNSHASNIIMATIHLESKGYITRRKEYNGKRFVVKCKLI